MFPMKTWADFLSGGGEMGELMRSFDWSCTPLGSVESWPSSLKTSVSLILSSQHPMWIGWGREMTFLYNDAYLHVLGSAKHPWALGRPASEVWSEIWNVCGPLANKVFAKGEASFVDDVRLFMNRGDFFEETFYSFSYSPIRDETGQVCGLFCPSTDVTAKVLNGRRLRTLSELAANALAERTTAGACATVARTLAKNPDDIPFALLYVADADGKRALLEQTVGRLDQSFPQSESIDLTNPSGDRLWQVAAVYAASQRTTISLEPITEVPLGLAGQRVSQALVLPVTSRGEEKPLGVLIAGVNPCQRLTAEHVTFFELIASQVATAVQNARAAEEERRRAEMLTELDRAKTAFFSNVSHEFRTPLTLMLGPLEDTLVHAKDLDLRDRERLEIAHRNSLRLLRLVNTLLDFSRMEAHRVQATYEPTDLAAFTAELASLFRSATERAGMKLTVDCPPLAEPVYVDREMWEKILFNLLSNAFKFTFQGEIEVSLREIGERVELTVRDTGTGIPPDELPHIFERFHRVRGARGRSFEGSGIGLALVQELVKLHGGEARVESEVDRGSRFMVSVRKGTAHLPADRIGVPRTQELAGPKGAAFVEEALRWLENRTAAEQREFREPAARNLTAPQPHSDPRRRARILVADDNADMREYVRRLLGDSYEFVGVSDGAQALQAARESPPDLVLTDVMMPQLDGFELIRALRGDERLQTVPIIVLSARAGEEARVEGLTRGADDYLAKPFSARELLARVSARLEIARIRRESEQALRRSEARYRQLADSMPQIVWTAGPDGVLDYCNQRWYEFTGRSADEPDALNWRSVLHAEDVQSCSECWARSLQTGESFQSECRFWDRHAEFWCWFMGRAVAVRDESGAIAKWFGTWTDIDDQKRIEEELRSANTDLEQFAYSASHDLQEPLRSITIYGELLETEFRDRLDGRGIEFLTFLQAGASRMRSLVTDLLAYTQVGRLKDLGDDETDAGAALQSALANLEGLIRDSGAQVTYGALPGVRAGEIHVQQLIQNIVGNALKYRHPGRRPVVDLRAERLDGQWLFSVRDNGIGIEPAYKDQIFGIFKRLHTSDAYPGTGIGLALCKRIVERYHGRIWVESKPEQGSTFFFTLPG